MIPPTSDNRDDNKQAADFAAQASTGKQTFWGEFWYFLRNNKRWWLTPIIIVLIVLTALIMLGGTGAAPLIYTLF